MNRINFSNFKRLNVFGAILFLAPFVHAQLQVPSYEERENYVELGAMKGQSSFEVVSPSEVSESFRIPVFNRGDYKNKVVRGVDKPTIQDISANKRKKLSKKDPRRLKLERALENLAILPIPKYNFGKERVLRRKKIGWSSSNYQAIKSFSLKRKKQPYVLGEVASLVKTPLMGASQKTLNLKEMSQKVILQNEVDAVVFEPKSNFEFEVLSLKLQEPKDLELLTADILYEEKKSCEEVVPLTEFLKDKKTPDNRVKFYRGMCLHDSKMFSESIPLLSEVIGTSTDYYAKNAVSKILEGLPKGYEGVIAEGLAPKNVYKRLEQKQKDKYNYILGKGHFSNEKFKRAEAHAKLVSEKSPDYNDAQFLVSTSQYMNGRLQSGIKTLQSLKDRYFKSPLAKTDFKSLIHITLGRFLFERGAYKPAIKEYEKVSREHPLWIDSLVEKGWAQVKLGDFEGAIGNMYTLQSPFFKDAFVPESHVIRTIGYLNICQFGDANDSLGYLENVYPEQKKMITDYIKSEASHHDTLKSYITKSNFKGYVFKGLPTAVVREMGRDRDYLVVQTKLNNIVDEIPMFKSFVSRVVKQRQNLQEGIVKLSEQSKSIKKDEAKAIKNNDLDLAKSLKKQRKRIFAQGKSLQYRINTFNKGIVAYKQANVDAVKRAEVLRDGYLKQAEARLRESLGRIDSRLDLVLRNNDLLRYEVYANSGKNIRYRVAGGKTLETENRAPALSKTKDYNWKFKGEFWEDEIGNFRSQLKNLCPKK